MTCSRPHRMTHRPGLEPGTPWSEIQCPNHCTSPPPCHYWKIPLKRSGAFVNIICFLILLFCLKILYILILEVYNYSLCTHCIPPKLVYISKKSICNFSLYEWFGGISVVIVSVPVHNFFFNFFYDQTWLFLCLSLF